MNVPFAITFEDLDNGQTAEEQFNEYCVKRPVTQSTIVSVSVNVITESLPHYTKITLIHFKKAD